MTDMRRRCVRNAVAAGILALTLGACTVPGISPAAPFTPAPAPRVPPQHIDEKAELPFTPLGDLAKRTCVYSYHRTEQLATFSAAVGQRHLLRARLQQRGS